jgi:hypothetical protein
MRSGDVQPLFYEDLSHTAKLPVCGLLTRATYGCQKGPSIFLVHISYLGKYEAYEITLLSVSACQLEVANLRFGKHFSEATNTYVAIEVLFDVV